MLEDFEFSKIFNISDEVFVNFVWSSHYYYETNSNPFHNFRHGVTVCHGGHYFLKKINSLAGALSITTKYAFLIACLSHDLDHTGKNNQFEIASRSSLALRYFEVSPLEHHHAAILLKILSNKECNIFANCEEKAWIEMKEIILECILATDMRVHFPLLAEFKQKFSGSAELYTEGDLKETLKVAIHVADLTGASQPHDISLRWSLLLSKEFTEQLAEERRLGLPETPHFVSLGTEEGFLGSELYFVEKILIPLFETFNEFSSGAIECSVNYIVENKEKMQAKLDAIKSNKKN